MPQLDAATPVRISSITPHFASRKLRVVGRMLLYNSESAVLLLADGDSALFVDISLSLNSYESMPWLREANSLIMAMGYLEEIEHAFSLPTLPLHARRTEVDPHLVLRALIIKEIPGMDINLWNQSVTAREKSVVHTPR